MRPLFLALLLAAGPAVAQDGPNYDAKLLDACLNRVAAEKGDLAGCIGAGADPCMDQPGGQTTIGMVSCLTEETRQWDMLLNAWYSKAMDRAKASDKALGAGAEPAAPVLKQAQRNWIAYRDESCRFEALRYQGGTMRGIVHADCLEELTARQALRLRMLAEEEG